MYVGVCVCGCVSAVWVCVSDCVRVGVGRVTASGTRFGEGKQRSERKSGRSEKRINMLCV